ncbi:MAG: transporter substrate-binding domain-containing protein [Desulfobacterales bacterium]
MRRFGMTLLSMSLVVAIAMVAGLAQAKSLDEIIKAGEIRVGINPTLPPLGVFNDKNEIDGFDKDVAQAIADALGVKLKIVKVGSPDRIPFVASDKIDFVMGAMTRNPKRAMIIDFTLPVHTEVFGVLTTSKNKKANWRDYNDPNITLVQVRGTTPVPFIKENLPEAKVLLLDNYPDVIRAIAQGRGQAMLDVVDFMWGHTATHKDVSWEVVDTPVTVYFCCLGVAKGNTTLRDWLNVQLFELHRNGVIDQHWEKWFGGPMVFKVPATAWF